MATNEETSFVSGTVQTKAEKKTVNQNLKGWQSVTIGGVTGILMGAGAMYAANAYGNETTDAEVTGGTSSASGAASHQTENGLRVAEVDQNLSFGQAFEAARNAVGPGGVFHWHGGIYNTYRAEEWNNMTDDERAEFAHQVQPEIQPGEGHTAHAHQNDVAHNDHHHEEPAKQGHHAGEPKPEEPHPSEAQDTESNNDDGDIHFLGFTNVEVDGQQYQAGHLAGQVNGEERHVYYIDVDNAPDNEFDVAVTDLNGDGVLTSQEAFDVRENHITVEEFALASAMEGANQDSNQVAMVNQNDIANDMPDYMNDANTSI